MTFAEKRLTITGSSTDNGADDSEPKQSFTPEEWTKILESTMLAGIAVTAEDPSGLWGLMKEGFASSSALAEAKADPGSNELVKAVVAEYETSAARSAVQKRFRKRFAGAPSQAMRFSALSTICGRSRRSLLLRRRAMLPPSRLG